LVSRGGVCPVSWSQDAVGPIARTVEDLKMYVFEVISGYFDERDNTTAVTLLSISTDGSWRGSIQGSDPSRK
jgi:Asp-tRNA(Asn)/Glu-tRNA(Gln) amidotransferase A subunit family amidase